MHKPTRVRGKADGTFDVITVDDEEVVANFATVDLAIASTATVTTEQVETLETTT